MYSLLLTLGHGSSAILVDDGNIVCGFENERLTGVKSDSSFPEAAITRIFELFDKPDHMDIYVSHWFMNPVLPALPNKWWNPIALRRMFVSTKVMSLTNDFTHHTAHALSAEVFAGKEFMDTNIPLIMVCDGFGTYGEVISTYRSDGSDLYPNMKRFGFDGSLGLMYQYATSYLGLKMNQDEYKLLGYEASIGTLDIDLIELEQAITDQADKFIKNVFDGVKAEYDPMISMSALPATSLAWSKVFDRFKLKFGVESEKDSRILIAKLVQGIVERTVIKILDLYDAHHLVVCGGVFMNVKLNNAIAKYLKSKGGSLCVMPLCGDSGAALGVYQYYNGDLEWPDHVFWGIRSLNQVDHVASADLLVIDRVDAASVIRDYVNSDKIVNVVQGSMEFGPRALGHTSTVAKPTMENVFYINSCNGRSTVMPMAGVCRDVDVGKFHKDADVIYKSMEYMICTRDYVQGVADVRGAAHLDPDTGRLTGRTQIVSETSDSLFYDILSDELPLMINTSFNPHGTPILYSLFDIVKAHQHMKSFDVSDRVLTIIVK